MNSRSFCKFAASILLGVCTASAAASEFPSRPITIVVPYTPGGTTDMLARKLGQDLSARLHQPVIVENKPGAGTAVAAALVAKSVPDGYTLLVASNATLAVNPYLEMEAGYSATESFTAISRLAVVPNVIVVRNDSPYQTLEAILKKPVAGQPVLSYGSMGTGTSNHIGMEVLAAFTGTQLLHIPYKGSAPALTDLMGGHVDMVTDTLVATLPHIKAGKLRALAVFNSERPKVQDVTTVSEVIGKPVDIYSWFGLVAPKGTPATVIEKLNEAVAAALSDAQMANDLEPLGVTLQASTPGEFEAFAKEQRILYGDIIQSYNLRLK